MRHRLSCHGLRSVGCGVSQCFALHLTHRHIRASENHWAAFGRFPSCQGPVQRSTGSPSSARRPCQAVSSGSRSHGYGRSKTSGRRTRSSGERRRACSRRRSPSERERRRRRSLRFRRGIREPSWETPATAARQPSQQRNSANRKVSPHSQAQRAPTAQPQAPHRRGSVVPAPPRPERRTSARRGTHQCDQDDLQPGLAPVRGRKLRRHQST